MAEIPYRDGKLEGIEKGYYVNGKLMWEVSWKDNKQEGIAKLYYKNGTLRAEIKFEKNEAISGYVYDKFGQKTRATDAHLYDINKNHGLLGLLE